MFNVDNVADDVSFEGRLYRAQQNEAQSYN